jgi:ketosteroid isomerase-like protein
MNFLTEDASYLLIGLGVAALGCLLALKVTQQGKFLFCALGLLVLAGVVFGFEHFWVTDAERVEKVVYDLASAVQASDVERIKIHLDEQVTIGTKDRTMDGSAPLRLIFSLLQNSHFDYVKVGQLTTSVGSQTKMGKAEFKATATGTYNEGVAEIPIGSLGTVWSLSFRETSPGVWKVTRIQAIKVPLQVSRALFPR